MEGFFMMYPSTVKDLDLQILQKDYLNPAVLHLFDDIVVSFLDLTKSPEIRVKTDGCIFVSLLEKVESLLNYTWEHLHTGEWKDVNISWRFLYSYASLFKSFFLLAHGDNLECKIKNAITACDMGLIMGAPILNGLLNKIAENLHRHLADLEDVGEKSSSEAGEGVERVQFPAIDPSKSVEIFHQPTIETFLLQIMDKKPALLTGVMDFWPAMRESRWSVNYLKKTAGHRIVPIEIGSKYTDDNWSQSLVTVNKFIDQHICDSKTTGYLAQYQLFQQIPQLKEDIITPDYCYLGESDDVQINAWFGPRGTVSPLHYDPDHNFLSQVVGAKYVRLYPQKVSDCLYPNEGMLSNTSRVDVESPDNEAFPKFTSAPYFECILSEGSMLYIPPRMWHYVRSLSTSFSVSFWWK